MIAGPREERLNVLAELVRLGAVERDARDRGAHALASEVNERMREVVSLLGFDPLEYEPARDAVHIVLSKREKAMLDALPATTGELARAAGIHPRHVRDYLHRYISRGEIATKREGRTTRWEVVG